MLDINLEIIIAQTITFAMAVGLLWWILFRPAAAFLQQRADSIAEDRHRAADERIAGERLRVEYEQQLAGIAAKTQEALRTAAAEAHQARDRIMNDAHVQSEALLKRGQEQLTEERARVIRDMRQQVLNLSMQLTEKMLASAMTPNLQRQLLDSALQELEAMPK